MTLFWFYLRISWMVSCCIMTTSMILRPDKKVNCEGQMTFLATKPILLVITLVMILMLTLSRYIGLYYGIIITSHFFERRVILQKFSLYVANFCWYISQKSVIRSYLMVSVIPGFYAKPSTHRMHDSGSIVPHIWPKVFTDYQMSWIKYNYYISNVSKDSDNSHWNRIVKDSITPQEWQPRQHIA
jgi:hypothetical protein